MIIKIHFYIDKKQLEYDINKQQIESLQENIQVFNGSMTELTNRLEQYDSNLLKKASEITEVYIYKNFIKIFI